MNTIKTLEEAKAELDRLASTVLSSSRLKRCERDDILATIYSIDLETADRDALMAYIIEQRKFEGANRAYLKAYSNGYVLPLRFVFPSVEDRSNVSRYSGALDQLAREGVPPHSYLKGVKEHGGLMRLYWLSRDRITRRQKRQTITLDRPIEVVDGMAVSLVLIPDKRMVFHVAEYRLLELQEEAA